jgi:hypothetical protein
MWTTAAALMLFLQVPNAVDIAGRSAEVFWRQFSSVQSRERVVQTRQKADGKSLVTQTMEFDYVAFLKGTPRGLSVEESRVTRSRLGEDLSERLLITSGFPTLLLMFHPEFRDRFDFTLADGSNSALQGAPKIAFVSKPDQQSMSALKLKNNLYPIHWKGVATLDAAHGAVQKIQATLATPMNDLGLSELQVDVEYGPATLAGASETLWLPKRAAISLKTPRQAWRNVHEFSDFKKFSVTTSARESAVQ